MEPKHRPLFNQLLAFLKDIVLKKRLDEDEDEDEDDKRTFFDMSIPSRQQSVLRDGRITYFAYSEP